MTFSTISKSSKSLSCDPHRYHYLSEATRKNCLDRLRESNRQLELYNLFLDDAIAQIDSELRQQKRERLLQKVQPAN